MKEFAAEDNRAGDTFRLLFLAVAETGTKPVKGHAVTIRKAFVTTCTLAAPVERLFELH